MVSIVIIKKNGTICTKNVASFDVNTLYKKCSFRKNTHFLLQHTWKITSTKYIQVFAKNSGRANSENKYDFPPPIDTILFFGSIALVQTTEKIITNTNVTSLTDSEWNVIYETLFGGFDNINSVDSYESDELESCPKKLLTKHGYLKDGFVISEHSSSSEYEDDGDCEIEDDDSEDDVEDDGDVKDDGDIEDDVEDDVNVNVIVDECDIQQPDEYIFSDDTDEDDSDDNIGSELTEDEYEDSEEEY